MGERHCIHGLSETSGCPTCEFMDEAEERLDDLERWRNKVHAELEAEVAKKDATIELLKELLKECVDYLDNSCGEWDHLVYALEEDNIG